MSPLSIAYEFRATDIWPDGTFDWVTAFHGVNRFSRDARRHRGRALTLGELEQIKYYIQLMMAASNKHGRFAVKN